MYKIAFRSDCMLILPFFSEEQITDHVDRYALHIKLDAKKK